MLDFVIFAVVVIVALIVTVFYLYPGSKRVTTIPGPDVVDPLEGNLPELAAAGSLHEFLLDLHRHYGEIVHFWMGPRLTVSIGSPKLFKQHAKVFDRPPEIFALFEPLIGSDAIQYANGAEGRQRHGAYGRVYSHRAMDDYYSIFQKMTVEMCRKWRSVAPEEHLPLRQYMFAFAIKTVLQASFGQYFKDEKEVLALKRSYDICWREMEAQVAGEKLEEGSPRHKLFLKEREHMYKAMSGALEAARQNPLEDGDPVRLVDVLIEMKQAEGVTANDMLCVFIAAFHTTGTLLTWALYYLAEYPEVQQKAREEINTVLEGTEVTPQSLPHLVYLRQVIDETLRCSVLAPFAARVQDFDSELGGHVIPKGTPVIHALGVVLTDPELWPEPEKFDPERFSEANRPSIPAYAFEPFGFAGGRKCMGFRFSLVEATVFLAEVLKNFTVSLVPDQVVQPEFGLVTSPKEEIWVTVKPCKK